MERSSICPFVTGVLHFAECFQSSSMFWHIAEFPYFLRLNSMYYTTLKWHIHNKMYLPHFVYPFICQWTLGLFPSLATVNNSQNKNVGVQISLQGLAFSSLGYILVMRFWCNFRFKTRDYASDTPESWASVSAWISAGKGVPWLISRQQGTRVGEHRQNWGCIHAPLLTTVRPWEK